MAGSATGGRMKYINLDSADQRANASTRNGKVATMEQWKSYSPNSKSGKAQEKRRSGKVEGSSS
eukprot:866463-Pyramimonas_sp.AAC.1